MDPVSSSDDVSCEDGCSLCKSNFTKPRVLSCLHMFCEECLKKYLSENGYLPSYVYCPDCNQKTKLNMKGLAGLPLDYITGNRIDLKNMEDNQIICTSCKAKDTAVARCSECATFLCSNCVTAHQFMRCFESHTVLSFDEMKSAGETITTIDKPLTCSSHPDESMKYYCHNCNVPICNECMVADHKQPEDCYEKAVDALQKQKDELTNLISESESKVQFCDEPTSILENHLSDLQMQRAKSHIEETFQSYKAKLEKWKKHLLKEMDSVQSSQELQIMETSHNVEKTINKIEDACKFAERLLKCGNTLEVLSLVHDTSFIHTNNVMASPDMDLASSSDDVSCEDGCSLCKSKFTQPRVLSCLHVFCEECLKKHLSENGYMPSFVYCPDCNQETKLNMKGLAGLPLDYITCNRIDLKNMEDNQIICTSCKAKDTAVARCSECATFLCPNCVTAHQFMRCFESHTVLSFDEMKSAGETITTIDKPLTCSLHPDESMKYYCHTCHVPICNECMVADHKQPEHCYEKAVDALQKQKDELTNLISESKSKVQFCDEATSILENHLSDLQMQRDNAKSHIDETFQSYKAKLEKWKEHLLKELDSVQSSQELQIMETSHNVEKTINKIEDACKFAERLLECGNTLEVLSLVHVVGTRLSSLNNSTPKLDISIGISFETNEEKFESSIQETFGTIKKPEPPVEKEDLQQLSQKTSPMPSNSSFESDAFSLSTGVMTPENPLPSLDVDLANNIVAQYNLAQLADMAEKSQSSSNATPPPINFADLLCTTADSDVSAAQFNAMNNLAALAKMGAISIHNGQPSLNSQLASALSMHPNSMLNSPPGSNHVMRGLSTPSPIESFESFVGGSCIGSPTSRVESPLNGPVMKGIPLLGGRRTCSPSILPPTDISPPMSASGYNPSPRSSAVKLSTMQIRCKFGQLGPGKSQFSSPHGFCLGLEEEIIVADTNNHRIQVFEKTGDFKYHFGDGGKEEGQLWYPRKVAVIKSSGKFVVCDRGSERSRMQIFTKTGHFLKKINIRYIDIVAGLAITNAGTIVAVDSVAPTVFIISEAGDLLHWFDCSEYMREPSDLAVCGDEFYICDFKGHCVIVFSSEGKFLRRIGCENVTNFPNGIDVSDAGDVLVGDSHGNRFHIVVFSRQGTLLSEFECPYVKVSRCCGLKITSEGYVVTLAKNNHHVLVLNTLYIM
ncbi:hypothetical protein JTE90_022820 [Oedothorax gibbosus]|uniref:Brain tumor protein n=1 Tax=Oedothorax gibbosus TaxID=931172 RepID=A0AAV6V8A3_9ARAC|nr:hypothetical protein JTE90_022820 [Oedothorax gibbosus]